ncbi:hypothetical protein FZI85_05765 [Mycobacterium sp. CBMA293]|uniref:hypothetical protein n=1 Tax=unclassified Mycolicibacterium TaxID=2636767 RepID=UPI0012DD5CEB|nr:MULTISPECIES: hypothetical protein [unclassified Mycolicibacterium]MUL48788.1 hypothetical protein [Mycolicibacterium sp. CBMA 360]MUL62243.1 hypothetical protein [Mycolicibacterium sp. CBMA 335]MUL71703.1 hypothetical protein [Mycolicibacterium sp. CBMA 311]MUL93658.1 hypothetical protein [Mycolicibacterium sp. CBMA 230]MUM09341.1 hypothetical protein [Mycolicibacterium sp. CBMA 213]
MTLTVFSINGYQGDMWSGPQADVARYLSNQGLNLAYWQPVGYNCTAFPLSVGVESGKTEFQRLRQQHPGPYLLSSWSEGSIISTEAVRAELAAGISDCKAAVAFGNPYRAAGHWNPSGTAPGAVGDPSGAGIGGPDNNWTASPDWWHNYAHGPNQPSYDGNPGVDIYTCCPTDQTGEAMRIVFDFVLTQWHGAIADLWTFGQALITNGTCEVLAVTNAIYMAIAFYGSNQQRPHQDYSPNPAMNYLAGVARGLAQPPKAPD